MVVSIILGLLFLTLLYLLFLPIELHLNTVTNQFYVQLRGLAKASLESDEEELLRIRLKILFRNFYFYPLKKIGAAKTKKIEKKKVKKKGKKMPFKKILRLLKSFTIKKLLVDIDTGDCLTNAKLYPAFTFLNYHNGNFNINFEGRNQMVLYIQNRPIRIIRSFINI